MGLVGPEEASRPTSYLTRLMPWTRDSLAPVWFGACSQWSILGKMSPGSRNNRGFESQPQLDHLSAGQAARSWLRGLCRRGGRDECLDGDGRNEPPPPNRDELRVFLNDPDVPIDTNHLERALRVIPMGRKNWNFCWTELGAKQVGIVQGLIATCWLHGIDVYTYLVDVLQRVGQHPAARVAKLTPRLWKNHFAANPLRSALHTLAA